VDLTEIRLLVGVEFLPRDDQEVRIGVDVSGAKRERPFQLDANQVVPKRRRDALGEDAKDSTKQVSFGRVQLSVQFRQHVQRSGFLAVEAATDEFVSTAGPSILPLGEPAVA
jgi:hypothetical protein